MADTSGMVFHKSWFGQDYHAPDGAGLHVAYDASRGYFIRWQYESGDSMMSDDSFAKLCNMKREDYLNLMYEKYNGSYFCGLYFDNREDCQRAIDDVVQPVVLAKVISRKCNNGG